MSFSDQVPWLVAAVSDWHGDRDPKTGRGIRAPDPPGSRTRMEAPRCASGAWLSLPEWAMIGRARSNQPGGTGKRRGPLQTLRAAYWTLYDARERTGLWAPLNHPYYYV